MRRIKDLFLVHNEEGREPTVKRVHRELMVAIIIYVLFEQRHGELKEFKTRVTDQFNNTSRAH